MAIRRWWRALWQPTAPAPLPSPEMQELAQLVARAEEAYDRMYEARRAKEPYEDACGHFHQAIELARRLGLDTEVARLTARRDHVVEVYNSQFRYV
jgi:hypothetical protein